MKRRVWPGQAAGWIFWIALRVWAVLEEFLSVWVLFDIIYALKGYAGGSGFVGSPTDRSFAYRDL
jgi:hypothetical protein